MIKETELRLLNWVMLDGEKYRIQYGEHIDDFSDRMKGIPLTPELLEACDFEKDGFNAYNICISPWPDTHLKQLSFAGDYLYLREGDLSKNRIHDSLCVLWNNDLRGKMNLHQLQNLYHALAGTELEVNLPSLHKRDIIPFMTHK